jgi:outer membrane protein assembly factor BamB
MYAFDETTGNQLWSYKVGAPIYDTAAYDSGKVFFGALDSKGYALDGVTGNKLWEYQTKGQGFRDRWTVAGNGKVLFTPMLIRGHDALNDGTVLFHSDANPIIYNQPWATQKQTILSWLTNHPYQQPLYVVDQTTGQTAFTAPVLYVSGGSESEHAQPVLLPNGNANVIYRRSFGEASQWGATTNDAIYSGELDLTTGDILPVDTCTPGVGGINPGGYTCGNYKGQYTSDESSAQVRAGDILYLDIARGTYGLDTKNKVNLATIACYNNTSGQKFCETGTTVTFTDYIAQGPNNSGGGWRLIFSDVYSELNSDGNDIKRPTVIAGDTFYILHANTIVAVKGRIRP